MGVRARVAAGRPGLRQWGVYRAVWVRNRVRRAVWDLLGRPVTRDRVRAACREHVVTHPFAGLATDTGDAALDARLAAESAAPHVAWAYRYDGDLLIEPRYGYAIDGAAQLLDVSMPFSEWSRDPRWRHLIGFPSVTSVLAGRVRRSRQLRLDAVISLRFYWDDNYFHLLNDILPRLRMADELGVPKYVPVLVGHKLAGQPFFRELAAGGRLDGRPVVEQGDRFVAARSAYFLRPPADVAGAAFAADLLGAPARPVGARRVFVNRAAGSRRSIVNFADLEPVLARFGFEVVDTDGWSLADQVARFSAAEYVAGVHGAGLANMIFRRGAPCSVFEIFPPDEALPYYAQLSSRLGFAYAAMTGAAAPGPVVDRWQPFRADPDRLAEGLAAMLARGSHGGSGGAAPAAPREPDPMRNEP